MVANELSSAHHIIKQVLQVPLLYQYISDIPHLYRIGVNRAICLLAQRTVPMHASTLVNTMCVQHPLKISLVYGQRTHLTETHRV